MKTIIISAAALALLVSPAMAQNQKKAQTTGQSMQQSQQLPRLFVGPGIIQGNAVYDCTGKYLGADPDVNIRHQLLREGDPSCAAGAE
jgi:hypothetical protein